MKTTLTTLTLRVLMLFPIFTLLSFVPGANTLLVIVSLALIVALILKKGISKKNFWLLFIALLSTVWNLFITGLQIINYNEVIHLMYRISLIKKCLNCRLLSVTRTKKAHIYPR